MEFHLVDIILPVFGGLASIIGYVVLNFLSRTEKCLERLASSVESLNVAIAVVVSKVESHDKRLATIEDNVKIWERENHAAQDRRVAEFQRAERDRINKLMEGD